MGSLTPLDDFAFEDGDNHQLALNLMDFVASPNAATK
jgi:hypothetical protein